MFFNFCFLVYRYLIPSTYSLSVLCDSNNTNFFVFFLLGDSPASEFYMPTFRNRQSIPKTSAHKIRTPGNHPKETIQHSGHGESFKSRRLLTLLSFF